MGTTGLSITLANSIIGVGILAMPFCFQQCGVLLATLILILMGLISRLCCYFLLKSALIARRRNFEFLAFHVFGPTGKLLVEVGIIGFLMGTCIAYFVVVGDLGPQIISKMFNINQSDILRTSIMVLVSLVCVLPLGLLRNVDSLSNVSAATICFYFCLVIKVLCEGSVRLRGAEGGASLAWWRPAGVLQCVPIFSMALFCQTQLFEIFESMPTLSLEKMNVVTKNAINICTAVYFTLGLFGYIAFSTQPISGNILMSLSPTLASDVIKLGFVMSLAFSFPLIIFPCRASLYSFLFQKVHSSQHDHIINHSIPVTTFRAITVAIIGIALCISLLIPNIELVLGLVGSTIGVLICVVFPCACFVNVTFKNTNERLLAKAILVLGLVIMVLGTYANLEAAEKNHEYRDEKYLTQLQIDKMLEDFVQKQGKQTKKPKLKEVKSEMKSVNEEIINDSEVQPPYPVPPDANENVHDSDKIHKFKDILPDDKEKQLETKSKEEIDKIKEDTLKTNIKVEDQLKDSVIVSKKTNKENTANMQAKDTVQDNINMMKQQQLIETIKQHGQEQKELIKEQKEILDEIKKTKSELQQNKKELGSEEAKKIAIESIAKIANKAIQSLTGVTDKPSEERQNGQKPDIKQIANEAVQDIAKNVEKTIKALANDNKESEKAPAVAAPINNANVAEAHSNLNSDMPAQLIRKPDNLIAQAQGNNQLVNNMIQNEPLVQNALNANQMQVISKNNALPDAALLNGGNFNQNNLIDKAPTKEVQNNAYQINNNVPPPNNFNNEAIKIQMSNVPIASQLGQNAQQTLQQTIPKIISKEHLHSPDEPQSYKQGEDAQKKNEHIVSNSDILQKVPLPVVMNGNSQIYKDATINKAKRDQIELNDVLQNVQNEAISNNNVNVRHKRESLDCSQISHLEDQERQICESLSKNTGELPLNVDLSDVGLNKQLPLEAVHHLRSLKSFNEEDKKR